MIIDLTHNKIVAETISDGFKESVEKNLVPTLEAKYGDTEIVGIQMYEDYISDSFMKSGYWYYPLTVVTADGCFTEWVKWAVNAEEFESSIPYSYIGDGGVDFKLTTNVPEEFEEKLVGRARFCEGGIIKLNVEMSASNITKLSGKYSQTFVDELARQITAAIAKAMSVEGLANGDLELSLVFAVGTYMEHITENVTYRRLILSDKASAPRDFWIKWTRLDGAVAYSVASNVDAENILFELGEDVSQKVREKEYRYLVQAGKDKYHNAMGRKNVTEWREIIKRAIRRGDLVKLEKPVELAPETRELEEKLADLLGRAGVAVPEKNEAEIVSAPEQDDEFERAMQKMREVANAETPEDEVATPVIPVEEETDDAAEELVLEEEAAEIEETAEETDDDVEELVLEEEGAEETADEETEQDTEETVLVEEADTEELVLGEEELAEELDEEPDVEAEEDDALEESGDGSEEIVYDTAEESDDDNSVDTAQTVEFFEEEDEEEEELDELEALYAESESALEISEGAVPANEEEAAELDEITRLAMEALKEIRENANAENEEADAEEITDVNDGDGEFEDIIDEEALSEPDGEIADEEVEEALSELRMLDPDEEEEKLPEVEEAVESTASEAVEEVAVSVEAADTAETILEETPVISPEREQDIRAEIEAKIRFEHENRARIAAEEEVARLRREQESMRIENERLLAEVKRENERLRAQYEQLVAETQRINAEREAKEKARRAEEEKLRAQIETQLRQETRERERLAEAARLAIEEQRRLEEENARREVELLEEEKRLEEERRRKEAEARAIAEREAEAERLRIEEETARARAAAAMPVAGDGKYSYTSKNVRFIFRRSVDPNITARIHEIIKAAIEYYGKDKVFMKIRATVPDSQTVNLEFLQIPIEEMELLSNLIKILGNSGLGIAKAIVE